MAIRRRHTRGQASPRTDGVYYPSSDGKPMAESDLHRDEMVRLIQTLQDAFRERADVYVSGNLLLYYEEGNPRRSLAPDVFVVFGVPSHRREIYKLWEEDRPPSLVIEVTSRTTRREDQVKKRDLYARLGVREYLMYDPLAEYLRPPLQGFELLGGEYRAMEPDADGTLVSEALDMRLRLVDGRLRLFNRRTGAELLAPAERTAVAEQRIAELEARLRERGQR